MADPLVITEEVRLQELKNLKQYFEQGFLEKEEYDARRLALIDASLVVPLPAVSKVGFFFY